MKRLLISKDEHETRLALLEDGVLSEYYVERPSRPSLVGNVYKGRVDNVLGGMDAAFVDIGTGRNGYLSAGEVADAEVGGKGPRKITNVLKGGKEILVQVTRDGMGTKGPRLTAQIGLPGRYVVYVPGSKSTGVSRRLDEPERERLRAIGREIKPETGGIIVRTAAEGASSEAIAHDLGFLQRVWAEVQRRIAEGTAPALVYRESELSIRAIRDIAGAEFEEVVVDDPGLCERLRHYLQAVAPEQEPLVTLHSTAVPLFEQYRIDGELRKALERRVELPSGGYLIIDYTEAMTVIDVNTGSYVGSSRLEDTSLKTNLEACREVVRQLRLRDIGGIVVIDFIDMNAQTNREAVLQALKAELDKDRTKTYVVELSPLGLVEMTRQNSTWGVVEVMTSKCPTCQGKGRVLSRDSALIAVQRRIKALAQAAETPGIRVEVHASIVSLLEAGSPSALDKLLQETQHFALLVPAEGEVPLDHVEIAPD